VPSYDDEEEVTQMADKPSDWMKPTDWHVFDAVELGRIEAQVEGQQAQVVRQVPPQPAQAPKPVWRIDSITSLRNGLKIRATETVSDRQVEYAYEPYYDSNRYTRTEVTNIGRKLAKVFADKGINVIETQHVPKPDLMEEMYQLLSIMMSDEAYEKYEQPWSTIKAQFDSLL
jgi:hypothetical protein